MISLIWTSRYFPFICPSFWPRGHHLFYMQASAYKIPSPFSLLASLHCMHWIQLHASLHSFLLLHTINSTQFGRHKWSLIISSVSVSGLPKGNQSLESSGFQSAVDALASPGSQLEMHIPGEEGIHRAWTPSQACLCWSCMATSPVDSEFCA